jgi:hypothetical protein
VGDLVDGVPVSGGADCGVGAGGFTTGRREAHPETANAIAMPARISETRLNFRWPKS